MAGTATRLITACKRILLGSLLYTVSLSAAAELVPIAVVDFTASSSTPYRSSLPEMVVNELVSSNKFDVLEREKLGSIIGEIGFQSASSFVPPDKAVQVGGMLFYTMRDQWVTGIHKQSRQCHLLQLRYW